MKQIRSYIALCIFMTLIISLTSCTKRNEDLTQKIILPNSDEIYVPASFVLENLQGDDSAIGRITNPDDSLFLLFFDIGKLAGEYADKDSKVSKRKNSVNEKFIYEEVDRNFINSEECCLYVTFAETGPTNFVSLKHYKDLVLDIMTTYESKE